MDICGIRSEVYRQAGGVLDFPVHEDNQRQHQTRDDDDHRRYPSPCFAVPFPKRMAHDVLFPNVYAESLGVAALALLWNSISLRRTCRWIVFSIDNEVTGVHHLSGLVNVAQRY